MKMKTIIRFLFIMTVMSCSVEDYNQPPATTTDVFKNHDAVTPHLIGRYTSVKGQSNYLPGTITITTESVLIDVPGYAYNIDLASNGYSTYSMIDCYYKIYFPDGTLITISDWIVWGNEIRLEVNNKLIIRLIKVTDEEPTKEEPIPEEPIKEIVS